MRGKRFALGIGFALLCAGWAQATAVPDDTFNLDFFDGWNSGASVGFTTSSTWSSSDETGYTQNRFCPADDWWSCICDPGVKFTVPDQPPPVPFTPSTSITIGEDGTFDQDFINDLGTNIAEIVFAITDYNPDATYTCSSPEKNNPYLQFFQFCGFKVDPGTLYIEFGNPVNTVGITTATPEPSQDVLLLIALGAAAMAQRRRARRSNG